jgi:hypothetical protein
MRLRRSQLLLTTLVATVACGASPDDEFEDEPGQTSDDYAITSSDAPPRRETHFASGDVDLTRYTSADETEWLAFEKFYRSRHSRPTEEDAFESVVERTKPELSPSEKTRFTNFVALKAYTMETFWFILSTPRIDQDYKLINTALRNVDDDPASAKSALAGLEGYIKSAASAVNALPPVSGTVHRRVYRAKCDAACVASWLVPYEVGRFVREPSFLSTSEREGATCFFRGQVHFVIASKGLAHSVKRLAEVPDEEEAIFPPGTVFKVEKVERDRPIGCSPHGQWAPQQGVTDKMDVPTLEAVIHLQAVSDSS